MARKNVIRKLFLFGRYSLAVLPPKKWLSELGIERGDTVHLEFDRARKRIILRFDSYQPRAKLPPKTIEKPEQNNPDGFEPIPEL